MVALFEPQAVVDCGEGKFLHGHPEIRRYFTEIVASGRKFARGAQQPALICGELALTSTRLPDGSVTAEVARRQSDGTWLLGDRSLHHRDRAIVARQVAGDCRATPAIRRLTGAASQQGTRNRCVTRSSELTQRASFG